MGMMSGTLRTIQIPTEDDFPVRADLYLPESTASAIIVLCHGFKGWKRWGFFPYVAENLQGAGFAALSIDFSHNGTGDDATGDEAPHYPRTKLFHVNTVSREFSDLGHVLRLIRGRGIDSLQGASSRIGFFGHSRGALVTLLRALEDDGIAAVCTWSTPFGADIWTDEQKDKWRRNGRLEFTDAGDGSKLSVCASYLDDIAANKHRYDLQQRISKLRVPHLLVHGSEDLIIDSRCASVLHDTEKQTAKKLVMVTTGHTFGIPYPQPRELGPPLNALRAATDETVAWFKTHLGERS